MKHEGLRTRGPGLGTTLHFLALACRLIVGAVLAWYVARGVLAPEIGIAASLVAVAILGITLSRPAIGLTLAVGLVPAGALLAAAPARTAELLAWAFLAGWLLRLWRPLAEHGWPRPTARPALLYAACAAASWIALGVAGAAGVDVVALPAFLASTIPADYLVFSIPETETWTALQLLTGVALFLAGAAIARADRALATWIAWTIVASIAVLAVATAADVARQWAANDYGGWFLARYLRGERFSLHLADVNAAGSQYVLAAGIAAAIAFADRRRRWLAGAAIVAMLPAFWLTGSRTAFLGAAGMAAAIVLAANARRVTISRRQAAAGAVVLVAFVLAGALLATQGSNERGSAGRAMRLRTQFAETSARMFVSAPIYGVGAGKYFERSSEFMPAELRALYGAENAHNYFAQTFAELGLVGGALFLWLLAATLTAGWRALAAGGRSGTLIGLFAGCTGYLVTCITGHPFLVTEVALPFWAVFGVLAAAHAPSAPVSSRQRALAAATGIVLATGVAVAAVSYTSAEMPPPERGFDSTGVAGDGTAFRWMSPHVTTYMRGGPGFLRLVVRAPDRPLTRPMVVETSVGGRLVDRREISATGWTTIEIPVRDGSTAPFRRVDIRATPAWNQQRTLAQRSSEVNVALTAMVSELRWLGGGR